MLEEDSRKMLEEASRKMVTKKMLEKASWKPQLVKYDSKGSAAKPQEPLSPFSFFKIHLSTSTFRHQ
jgi:hypothetical protein